VDAHAADKANRTHDSEATRTARSSDADVARRPSIQVAVVKDLLTRDPWGSDQRSNHCLGVTPAELQEWRVEKGGAEGI
jgi:hypothetical protein